MLSIHEFFYGNVEPLWVVGTAASPIPYNSLMLNLGRYNEGPNRPTGRGSGSPHVHVQQTYGPYPGHRNSQLQGREIQSREHEQDSNSQPRRTVGSTQSQHHDSSDHHDQHTSMFTDGSLKGEGAAYMHHLSHHGGNQPKQNYNASDGQTLQNRGDQEQPTYASNALQQREVTSGSHRDRQSADQKPRSLNIYSKENRKSGKSKVQVHHISDQHNGNSSHQISPHPQRHRSNAQSLGHAQDGQYFDNQMPADERERFDGQLQQSGRQLIPQDDGRHHGAHVHDLTTGHGDGSNSASHNNHDQKYHESPQMSFEYDENKSLNGRRSDGHNQNQHNLQESSNNSAEDSAGFAHNRARDWGRSSGSLQTGYKNSSLDQAGSFHGGSNNGPMAKDDAYGIESTENNQKSNQYYRSASGPKGSSYESDEEHRGQDQRNSGPQKSYNSGSPQPWPQSHEFRRPGNDNKPRHVRLWVDMCCESCEERVSGTLSNLNGTKSVECDFPNKKVVVYGTAAPADILKACRNLHKNSCMWSDLEEFHGSSLPRMNL